VLSRRLVQRSRTEKMVSFFFWFNMPAKAAEIYTYPPDAQTSNAIDARRACLCRFRGPGEECSQVEHRGNRAFVTIADHPNLIEGYGRERIPLGLCSLWDLQRGNPEPWVVCPHRLFYAGPATTTIENAIYQAWGLTGSPSTDAVAHASD